MFIGDGMGISQMGLTQNYLSAVGDSNHTKLMFTKTPIVGLQTTYSANSLITCSAAAGTALATAHKTNNGMLGVSPQGDTLVSVAEKLRDIGYNIGIISTVSLDHATPAALYANNISRNNYEEIANQLALSEFEYFAGGALLAQISNPEIWEYIKQNGYTVLNDTADINNHSFSDGKLFAISSVYGEECEIPYLIDAPKHDMHLPFFVDKMIKFFSDSDKGFFAMIESGKIDWACHKNDAAATISETILLDSAYSYAYDFYLDHPDETLIIITADHETGGLALGATKTKYSQYPKELANVSGSMEVFIEKINSMSSPDFIYDAIDNFYSLNKENITPSETFEINAACLNSMLSTYIKGVYDSNETHKIADICNRIINEKAGIGWTTTKHTGVAVPVYAIGCGAEQFSGVYDNTDVPKKILKLTMSK